MPKKGMKFITGFLIPNLNNEKFGEHLKWVDKSKKIFQIVWHHKGGPKWTEQEAEVFTEWDKHKGHFHPDDKTYYTKSKQRFRSLLYKLSQDGHLENLKCDEKYKKLYCIVKKKHYKRKRECNEFNAEYELFNEGVPSFDEDDEDDSDMHLDNIYRRIISKDDAVNVLEDHPYSCANTAQENATGCGHGQEMQNYLNSTSLYESSEYLEKRVLVEKNSMHEHFNSLMSNNLNDTQVPEDFLMNEDFTNRTKSSENLQIDPSFILTSYNKSSQENTPFTDISESWGLWDFSDLLHML